MPSSLTRANVIQIGFFTLAIGAIGFWGFRLLGLDQAAAGIAAEAILVFIVIIWTATYLFRVITGQMTFTEQRKRYRKAYEEITNAELQAKFDSLSKEEQITILKEIENQKNIIKKNEP